MILTKDSLNELKKLEVDMLKCFLQICEKHRLQYFLIGGSCLGAIRHQGFIPWDDDIDVALPREDYNVFLKVAQAELPEHLFLQTGETDPQYPMNFAKIRDSKTTFVENSVKNFQMNHGVYLDVFPLDGCQSGCKFYLRNRIYHSRIAREFIIPNRKENVFYKIRGLILKRLCPYYQIARDKRDKLLQRFPYATSDIVIDYGRVYGKTHQFPKAIFGEGCFASFEGLQVIVPEKYDEYLTRTYGDYLSLPPVELRVPHHACERFNLQQSYLVDKVSPTSNAHSIQGDKSGFSKSFIRSILDIIKCAIQGGTVELPPDFDWSQAILLGRRHQISALLYAGAFNAGLTIPESVSELFCMDALTSVAVNSKQQFEMNSIFSAFEKNGVDYVPLKGAVLKNLYPSPEYRTMGDADVLIRTEQYDTICPILRNLGYTFAYESNHELVWKKGEELVLELHKRLIPSYNKDYYAYFGDGWDKAKHKGEHSSYQLSDEDTFIFLFTHYAKHYRNGGIGIRHMVDFYVFMKAKPALSMSYIEKELEKLHLLSFYQNTMKVLKVWFEGGEGDELTDFITDRVFTRGSFGTVNSNKIATSLPFVSGRKNYRAAKRRKLWSLVFAPYRVMREKFPLLKKLPILLPFFWIVRFIKAFALKRDEIKEMQETLTLWTPENVGEYKKELDYVGLDFNDVE